MTHNSFIDSFKYRSLLPKLGLKNLGLKQAVMSTFAALALTACGSGGNDSTSSPSAKTAAGNVDTSSYIRDDDYRTGNAQAAVVFTEYASVTCPHCSNWYSAVYPDFKKKYIDTGKVLYIFRSFPTAPVELADAGHMIAMCAGEENYFKNIKLQFDRQKQIFDSLKQGKAREAYVSLAKASGLSEDEFIACIQDEDVRKKYEATVQSGYDLGVTGTPSFFINGEKQGVYDLESIEEIILPLLGEPIPEKAAEDGSDNAEADK